MNRKGAKHAFARPVQRPRLPECSPRAYLPFRNTTWPLLRDENLDCEERGFFSAIKIQELKLRCSYPPAPRAARAPRAVFPSPIATQRARRPTPALRFPPLETPFPDSPFKKRTPPKGANRRGQAHGGLHGKRRENRLRAVFFLAPFSAAALARLPLFGVSHDKKTNVYAGSTLKSRPHKIFPSGPDFGGRLARKF